MRILEEFWGGEKFHHSASTQTEWGSVRAVPPLFDQTHRLKGGGEQKGKGSVHKEISTTKLVTS